VEKGKTRNPPEITKGIGRNLRGRGSSRKKGQNLVNQIQFKPMGKEKRGKWEGAKGGVGENQPPWKGKKKSLGSHHKGERGERKKKKANRVH